MKYGNIASKPTTAPKHPAHHPGLDWRWCKTWLQPQGGRSQSNRCSARARASFLLYLSPSRLESECAGRGINNLDLGRFSHTSWFALAMVEFDDAPDPTAQGNSSALCR